VNLHSLYRLERDGIFTYEDSNVYFAYQVIEDEFHILEIYIERTKRGNSKEIFDDIKEFIKKYTSCTKVIGYFVPGVVGSEASCMSMLKYGFKFIGTNNDKQVICLLEI
jgi:hypothetical protein